MAKPGDVIDVPELGVRVVFLATSESTDGAYTEVDVIGNARGFITVGHVHVGVTELEYNRFGFPKPRSGAKFVRELGEADRPLLKVLTPFLRPVLRWNHNWAIARAIEGLEPYVRSHAKVAVH